MMRLSACKKCATPFQETAAPARNSIQTRLMTIFKARGNFFRTATGLSPESQSVFRSTLSVPIGNSVASRPFGQSRLAPSVSCLTCMIRQERSAPDL